MTPLFAQPPIDDVTAPFWEGLERKQIVLPRCSACSRFQWYPDAAGPDCPAAHYEWVPVASTGTVFTRTRIHRAFLPAAASSLPFTVGFVELDDVDGVRFVCNLDDEADIAIDDRVEARFDYVDGRWRPIFEPAKT